MTAPVHTERPTGIDRSNDPLMVPSDTTEPLRTLVMRSQWWLDYVSGYRNAPIAQEWAERAHHPRPGDLVYVPDRILGGRRDQGADTRNKSFGYFITARREPVYGPDEWERVKDGFDGYPCPTEKVFYIQYGPNPDDVCRWENAECRVIATEESAREVCR